MKRKIIILILVSVMLISAIPFSVSAAGNDEVAPCWENTGAITCTIGFPSDGYGYAEANVMAHPTSNHISGDVYVYRQHRNYWIYVGEEHLSVEGTSLNISCKFDLVEGAYYRADYTFVVTKNGVDETIQTTKYRTYSP